MKILGLDYVDKRIGVALGDTEHGLATPLTIIENRGLEAVVPELLSLLKEEDGKFVVVGWPVALSGKETEQTKKTAVFIEYIKERLSVPVATMDERFTTQAATAMTELAGREHDDAEAAAVMLQMYLDIGDRPL